MVLSRVFHLSRHAHGATQEQGLTWAFPSHTASSWSQSPGRLPGPRPRGSWEPTGRLFTAAEESLPLTRASLSLLRAETAPCHQHLHSEPCLHGGTCHLSETHRGEFKVAACALGLPLLESAPPTLRQAEKPSSAPPAGSHSAQPWM